ncbi:ATP-binding region, ATPase-like domain protein [Candidatus Magnetomorum sp. HK-1]|nr:ATP-binding region, ATPase-like domain protein [Candidatus Magnetomorum sp. HK-1]
MDIFTKQLDTWIRNQLFDAIPMGVAVIDKDFNILMANGSFGTMFGAWKNRKCYSVYKNRDSVCPLCKGSVSFEDGLSRVNHEVGLNKNGRMTRYLKHTIPVIQDDGSIPFLVEMTTDITEIEQVRREHQLLFDQVPCSIAIIDRDMHIIKCNKRMQELFGTIEGQLCYEAVNKRRDICTECPTKKTFKDGRMHSGHSIVTKKDGKVAHFLVRSVPLITDGDYFDQVMEMSVDVTQTLKLEQELKMAHTFMEIMIDASMDGIIAVDQGGNVTIFNEAARQIFNVPKSHRVTREELNKMISDEFIAKVSCEMDHLYLPETIIKTLDDKPRSVRLIGTNLRVDDSFMGIAFSIQDLRELKQLEKEKLESERLAAVGQTVAGLAHGVKNLISGLEGGMYMLNSGMSKSNIDRVQEGMEMLVRNIGRISLFVKEFLTFSKGRKIRVKKSQPEMVAEDVVALYAENAKKVDIELTHTCDIEIAPAPMDYEGMHECLTNLVGNAIDACTFSDNSVNRRHVWVKTYEKDNAIIYEVEDNGCGMDYEVKKKVFTNFFTTKGLGGTGLGLLTTQKIIQEHGGNIIMDSEEGKGTIFKICLPRNRLPILIEDDEHNNDQESK